MNPSRASVRLPRDPRQLKRWFLLFTICVLAAVIGTLRVAHIQQRLQERHLVESWTRSLEHYDPRVTQTANDRRRCAALRALGPVAVRVLIEDLHYNPPQRFWLKHGPEWLQKLLVTRSDWRQAWRPEAVRRQAAFHLADLGPGSLPALPHLLRRASDNDPGVRDAVAVALGSIGENSPQVISALGSILTNKQARPKFSAAFSLWRLQPDNPAARAEVERLITSRNLTWPSLCLCRIGEQGRDFAPALRRAMDNTTSSFARMQAAKALWVISRDPEPARALLESIQTQLNVPPRGSTAAGRWNNAERDLGAAAILLDDIPQCRELIKSLLQQVKNDSDSEAREMATAHLARIEHLDRNDLDSTPAQ